MKIFYYTFGCKVNQYETENIKEHLSARGFSTTDSIADSDICIINSCTVTSMADRKGRQLIHKIKKENPDSIIVLTGCFPQAFAKEAENMEDIDIITGTGNKTQIPYLIEEFLKHHHKIISINPHEKNEKFESMQNTKYIDKTRAIIKIQDGCDQYCTYCIIPYARGHIRSKPLSDLKNEVISLANAGHKEIVLVGINLSCYGKDTGHRLIDAIETACSINGIERVRLGSIEPELISDEDILRMSKLEKLCPQFHLSLQSGCDKTLKAMNRKYDTSQYEALVNKLRNAFADTAITTDIMVGFPGETDEDFNASLEFVKKIGFAKTHIFPYSVRKGTIAAKWPQVNGIVKEERAKKMKEICKHSQTEFLKSQIGKIFPVLFETENSPNFHHGYTPNYTLVKIYEKDYVKSLRRNIFYVKIIGLENDYCIGKIVNHI